jgi:hypothetical protein
MEVTCLGGMCHVLFDSLPVPCSADRDCPGVSRCYTKANWLANCSSCACEASRDTWGFEGALCVDPTSFTTTAVAVIAVALVLVLAALMYGGVIFIQVSKVGIRQPSFAGAFYASLVSAVALAGSFVLLLFNKTNRGGYFFYSLDASGTYEVSAGYIVAETSLLLLWLPAGIYASLVVPFTWIQAVEGSRRISGRVSVGARRLMFWYRIFLPTYTIVMAAGIILARVMKMPLLKSLLSLPGLAFVSFGYFFAWWKMRNIFRPLFSSPASTPEAKTQLARFQHDATRVFLALSLTSTFILAVIMGYAFLPEPLPGEPPYPTICYNLMFCGLSCILLIVLSYLHRVTFGSSEASPKRSSELKSRMPLMQSPPPADQQQSVAS